MIVGEDVALAAGEEPFTTVAPKTTRLTDTNGYAEIRVAYLSKSKGTLKATLGSKQMTLPLAASSDITRYAIRVPRGALDPSNGVLQVQVTSRKPKAALDTSFVLTTPTLVMARFEAHVEKLMETAPHELVKTHLTSTRHVLRQVYDNLPLEAIGRPDHVEFFMKQVELISRKLPSERFDWDKHLRQALPLVFTFVSKVDRSLQFYALQLPYRWEAGQTYPLTVYLHGMVGNENPLTGLVTAFDNTHQNTLFREVDIHPDSIPEVHGGFLLAPWGRGNMMYRDIAEWDVWQSIDEVKRLFSVDEDRMYMSGFSMGCHGTYHIAARTPDVWAGINLASGFGPWSDTHVEYLMDNVMRLPINAWIGDLDPMVDGARRFDSLLTKRKHPEHTFTVRERTPHTYPYESYTANMAWTMQHKRKRPSRFSFVADDIYHTSCWRITIGVPWRVPVDSLPRFTCSVVNNTVTIDSRNTGGLEVVLGEKGLGLSGDVKVVWNGKEAYAGPAKNLALGEEIPWWQKR
jgi:predicted esterase